MIKDWIARNKIGIGAGLTAICATLLVDPMVRDFIVRHPWFNTLITSLTSGLVASGVFKSDRDAKLHQEIKKLEE